MYHSVRLQTTCFRDKNTHASKKRLQAALLTKKHSNNRFRRDQVVQSDLVWTHKWPFQGLSDLHWGNQKVTLKKLGGMSIMTYRTTSLHNPILLLLSCSDLWLTEIHLTRPEHMPQKQNQNMFLNKIRMCSYITYITEWCFWLACLLLKDVEVWEELI